MIFKRFSISLAVLTLLLTSTSCSGDTSKQAGSDLTIYLTINDIAVSDAIVAFNDSQRKTKITSESFNVIKDYTTRLQSELASGKGPDIIVFKPYTLPNLSKYINAGVFTDLNELIKKDKDFNTEDYNEKILSCGVIDGKRFLMPLSYTIDGLFTTQEILDSSNLQIDKDTFSMEELASISSRLKTDSGQSKQFIANTISIYPALSHFTDAYKATAQFDSEPFLKLLNNYKDISGALYPADNGSPDLSEPLKNTEVLFISMPIFSFSSMTMPYEKFDSLSEPRIFAIPSVEKNREVMATPYTMVAINKNCKNKDEAYSFVKSLLEVEQQTRASNFGLPVNNLAYEKMKEDFLNNMANSPGSSVISDKSTLAKLAEQLDGIVSGNMTCKLTDYEIEKIVGEEINTLDTKPADTVSKSIQGRTLSYFSRNDLEAAKAMIQETPQTELPTMSIQYIVMDAYIENAIRIFNDTHSDIQIKGTGIPVNSINEFRVKLASGIMAGDAPDIMVYQPNLFNSFSKVLDTGVFCDLNELIAQDKTFDESHYYPSVFNTGMHNGKRLFIPLLYELPLLASSGEALGRAGISIDESNWTLEELRRMILESSSLSASDNKYFFSSVNFNVFLKYCGIDFIDEETKTSHFQSKEFIKLMKLYKDILPYIVPEELDETMDLDYRLVKNGTIVMQYLSAMAPIFFSLYNTVYSDVPSESLVLYPFPTLEKRSGSPVGHQEFASISQNCKHKQAAFDFIEILLSPDIQMSQNSRNVSNGHLYFPINNTVFRKDIEYYETFSSRLLCTVKGVYSLTVKPIPLPESIIDRAVELNSNIGQSIYIDKEVLKIVNEGIQPFLDGKLTAEEAAKNIDEKVTIFINE